VKGAGRPVWDDTAPPEDLRALDPGLPDPWPTTPDVLVVGGGVIGLAVAASCAGAGMRVVLIEQGRLANAASGRAAGGLSPDAHPDLGAEWHALARSSLALHRQLDAEWDYGLRSVDLLIPPEGRVPDQAHVDPLRLAAALARRAGTVACGVRFVDWDVGGERVMSVQTTNGDVSPGAVVLATGAAPEACATNECWVKGHLIATQPAPIALDEIVADGEILVVQLPDGRFVAGGTKDREDDANNVDAAVVAKIEGRLVELVPGARGLRRTHAWSCFRPCAADERPVIDLVGELSNAWVVSGLYSTGLLMAPIVGRIVADWIAGERRPGGLETFVSGRLRR
jgi:glycine oxidase